MTGDDVLKEAMKHDNTQLLQFLLVKSDAVFLKYR
jgi:hypothetical protein